MTRDRLEAFSDGVLAIVITIMVLEIHPPPSPDAAGLLHLLSHEILLYLMSFVYLGIYWNNHHHMLHATERVNGSILWANQHLLFWLSLVPFCTRWLGESHLAPIPTASYGVVLLLSAVAYFLLQSSIIAHHGPDSALARAVGRDWKGKTSLLAYTLAIPMAFLWVPLSIVIYALVALMWLVPDRRIERHMPQRG